MQKTSFFMPKADSDRIAVVLVPYQPSEARSLPRPDSDSLAQGRQCLTRNALEFDFACFLSIVHCAVHALVNCHATH